MRCERILKIDDKLEARLVELAAKADPQMNVRPYIQYIRDNAEEVGLFGMFNDELMGFIYAEKPNAIYEGRGYLYLTSVDPSVPLHVSKELFEMMLDWEIKNGATYLWGWTSRSPKVIKRLYGFEIVKERQVVRPLVGDDHLQIERDTNG